jgi:hypothetical protein
MRKEVSDAIGQTSGSASRDVLTCVRALDLIPIPKLSSSSKSFANQSMSHSLENLRTSIFKSLGVFPLPNGNGNPPRSGLDSKFVKTERIETMCN